MRIIFAGTPVFAAKALDALLAENFDVILVLTQPDRPAGRGMRIQASPVKLLAKQHNIPLFQPETLKSPTIQEYLRTFQADVMIVAAYGLLLPETTLQIPRYGCINIHASLLARWRGAAPIQRAILAGDQETGISIMQMDRGLDTGAILLQHATPIESHDTSETLHDKLAHLGGKSIVETLVLLHHGKLTSTQQNEMEACYASKVQKAETEIDWKQDAAQIDRMIRAFNPNPGAFTYLHGSIIKLWQAKIIKTSSGRAGEIITANDTEIIVACGQGALSIKILQKASGKRLSAAQFIAGHSIQPGENFSMATQ